MQKISYIEVDEKNGMLKVPSEIAGKVAQLIKQCLQIDIVEIPIQNKKKNNLHRQVPLLLQKFHKYCKQNSFGNLEKELTKQKQKHKNSQQFKCSDIYELSNVCDLKEEFKLKWESYLSNGNALKTLEKVSKENLENTKIISLLLLECQKNAPYQSFRNQ